MKHSIDTKIFSIAAFDGLSLSGKSTMVQMLKERSKNTVIMRENQFDPIRTLTSYVNRLLKNSEFDSVFPLASERFPEFDEVLEVARGYSNSFIGMGKNQALLAYLFTKGRNIVNDKVEELAKESSVILDRYRFTGCAYQVEPNIYSWQEINSLNDSFGIIMPDIQFLLTCPIDQVPIRRSYRQKQGRGTAGQMSIGREDIILPTFHDMYESFKDKMQIYMIENSGTPVPSIEKQIQQAIPTYCRIEDILSANGWEFKDEAIGDQEGYWLEPNRLHRIYNLQTIGKKIEE